MKIANVVYVKRPEVETFRVYEDGKLIHATRCNPADADRAAARERLQAWSTKFGYQVVDKTGRVVFEPQAPAAPLRAVAGSRRGRH